MHLLNSQFLWVKSLAWLNPLLRLSHSCNEGISSADVISKLNWGRIHFCAQLVVIGKTSSLAGSWTQGLCSSLAVGQRLLQFLVL